jgi:S1-C subfamily serine protease
MHDRALRIAAPWGMIAVFAATTVTGCSKLDPRRQTPSREGQALIPTGTPLVPPSPLMPPSPSGPAPIAPLSSHARIEDERNTVGVFREVAPSTVFVTQKQIVVDRLWGTESEVPAGSGSGFLWDTAGHVVTNFHVVNGARSLTVTLQGDKTFNAAVVGVEPRKDIAVLKIDAPSEQLVPIRVPQGHEPLEVGQKAIAIGNPFGLDHTLTTGVISAIGRQVDGIGGVTIRDMVQTDAAINPGNSGGPLLDSGGQLIGMNTMIFSKSGTSAGIGFAVPVAVIARVVPQLIKSGKVEQVGLGINIDPSQRIERRYGIKGVVVLGLAPGGAAERAGMHGVKDSFRGVTLGDVIVAIDGKPVPDYDGLYNALDGRHAGERAKVEVQRDGKTVPLEVELQLLP